MNAAALVLAILAATAWLAAIARPLLVAARMFQIEEYERIRFLRWGMTAQWLVQRAVLGVIPAAGGLAGALLLTDQAERVAAGGLLVGSVLLALLWTWAPPKKALVLTARMRRLFCVCALLVALAAGVCCALLVTGHARAAAVESVVLTGAAPLIAQLALVVSDVALVPVESGIRQRYLRAASRVMRSVDPLVVAVAGSYGKTSTKHIIAALLQPSIETLATRASFNTLMGVTRVINEDLQQRHRVFVVEMDAYAPGEIRDISRLVHQRVAVLTSVGPQHLERFGTMERLAGALYEVIAELPAGGTAIVHGGEPVVAALADRAVSDGRHVVRYGVDDEGAGLDVVAASVHVSGEGARFTWTWQERSLQRDVTIPLLGRHQVLNVTAALAVVAELGHDVDAAVRAAAQLQPVEHRLQPLRTGGPVTVIDDSYNANPVGVHNALDVLAAMDGGQKILVTPGLVELGSVEEAENRRYGEHAALVCSEVIVLDARPAVALRAGLRAGGLDDSHIHLVRNLADATAVIGRVSRPGDVVLFANDLPDTYLAQS